MFNDSQVYFYILSTIFFWIVGYVIFKQYKQYNNRIMKEVTFIGMLYFILLPIGLLLYPALKLTLYGRSGDEDIGILLFVLILIIIIEVVKYKINEKYIIIKKKW